MPMTWTDQADAKLLVAIIAINTVKLDWKAIAEFIGTECTPIAVQRRIQRIKEKAKAGDANGFGNTETADTCDSLPVTPEKRKRGPAKKSGAAVTTGGDESDSGDGNSADAVENPLRKARGRPKGKGKNVVSRTEEGADGAGVEEQGILVDAHVKMDEAF